MCGIAGFFHFDPDRPVSSAALTRMADSLRHRGPDGGGFFVAPPIGLAHRRLSIIDLKTGDQPMSNDDQSIVVVFNGEIYNYVELREELSRLGHGFRTSSDTEVLIHGYAQWGMELFGKLNGMWAFALWDARERQLLLSVDRVGEKPVYFGVHDGTFYFGSEIKALLAGGMPREANLEVLELFLTFGYVPAPNTFFKGVRRLQPGRILRVKDGQLEERRYWELPQVEEAEMRTDGAAVREEFEHLLRDSVRIRMRSDVPFGAFLSGGLDSSCIVAMMSELHPQAVRTFTIGFTEKAFDERQLSRQVAQKFRTEHEEEIVAAESFTESLAAVLHHFDEPFGDASAINVGTVSRIARRKVKMVLTGDGGDEALSGYPGYQSEKLAALSQWAPSFLQRGAAHLLGLGARCVQGPRKFLLTRLRGVMETNRLSFEERLLQKTAWCERPVIKSLLGPLTRQTLDPVDILQERMHECRFRDGFYRMMHFNFNFSLPDHMLVKVDRMSMAHSLESRIPFLDHRLIELMARVHKNIKMPGFERKAVLRQTIGRRLPPDLLKAPKKGFEAPVREWFRTREFADRMQALLKRNPLGLNPQIMEALFRQNAEGQADHGVLIWMLFQLDRWAGCSLPDQGGSQCVDALEAHLES